MHFKLIIRETGELFADGDLGDLLDAMDARGMTLRDMDDALEDGQLAGKVTGSGAWVESINKSLGAV